MVAIEPGQGSVLIAGRSGVGKSTLATALTERMVEHGFGFCVIDPEGDYSTLEHAVCVGDAKSPPVIEEALNQRRLSRKLQAHELAHVPFAGVAHLSGARIAQVGVVRPNGDPRRATRSSKMHVERVQ